MIPQKSQFPRLHCTLVKRTVSCGRGKRPRRATIRGTLTLRQRPSKHACNQAEQESAAGQMWHTPHERTRAKIETARKSHREGRTDRGEGQNGRKVHSHAHAHNQKLIHTAIAAYCWHVQVDNQKKLQSPQRNSCNHDIRASKYSRHRRIPVHL